LDRWRTALPAELKDSPHIAAGQLVPEICVAVSRRRPSVFLIGFTELPNPFDPLDELAGISPLNFELIGVLLLSGDSDGSVTDFKLYRSVLAQLNVENKHVHVYLGANRGHGPPIGSMTRLDMDGDNVTAESPVVISDLDPSMVCASFRPRFHAAIGYFAAANLKPIDARPLAYFLQSDDGATWRIVGHEGSVPVVDS
jgi:hypothetical protein